MRELATTRGDTPAMGERWMRDSGACAPFSRGAAVEPLGLAGAVAWSTTLLLLTFFVDALLFRTGVYGRYVDPSSSTGRVEWVVRRAASLNPRSRPRVAVVGDSRVGQGFAPEVANSAVHHRVDFFIANVAGSGPRVWSYLLRDVDPDRTRFNAIAFVLPTFAEASLRPMGSRASDLNMLILRLGYADCGAFAASFPRDQVVPVFARCLLPGIGLRRDLRAFLEAPAKRLASVRAYERAGGLFPYAGQPESLAGLAVDWSTRTLALPPSAQPWQIDPRLERFILAPPRPTDEVRRYQQRWLGEIVARYDGTGTRIVFLEHPRAPLPPREDLPEGRFIDAARAQPGVVVMDRALFRDLERPEAFADALHLNAAGRRIFSERLARAVAGALEG
jgi:hypothetical protein